MNDYENKAQGYAILSAQYSKDAYFFSRYNFFLGSIKRIKQNCDTSIVNAQIAIEYADSAILVADDTSVYAKGIMLYAKVTQQKAIKRYYQIIGNYDEDEIHYLSEKSMYLMGNALADAYKASLAFAWVEEEEKEPLVENDWGDTGWGDNGINTAELVYRVQIGLFKKKLSIAHFEGVFPISTQVSYFLVDINGKSYHRHIAGSFIKYEDAHIAQKIIREKGYTDAFVVAYINGEKVSTADAIKKENNTQNEVVYSYESDDREFTRLEADEQSYITIKELYGKRLAEIDDELILLNAAAKKSEGKKLEEINGAIAQLSAEEKKSFEKMKNSEDRLINVQTDLSEEMLTIVNKDIFTIDKKGFYNENIPVPTNTEVPKGLVYRVQIGFFKSQLPPEHFDGIFPISSQKIDEVYYQYAAGNFAKYEDVKAAKIAISNKGYSDSFIVAYIDGKKVSISKALEKEKEDK